MSEIVERVARAIMEADKSRGWPWEHEPLKATFRRQAKAAIKAINVDPPARPSTRSP